MLVIKPGASVTKAHPPKSILLGCHSILVDNIVIKCFEALLFEQQTLVHTILPTAQFN